MSGNPRNSRRDKVWVSHNRVLIGGNKKNVRNPNFDTEETKLLINLWGNPAIQKTLITSHKKFPIITKLSETMRQYGYQRTPEEINTRLKNLKCLYNRLKKDVECGIRSHPTWKHFGAMDAILTRPIFGYQNTGDNPDEDEDSGQLMVKDEVEVEPDEEDELRPEDLLQVETTPEEIFLQDDDDVVIKEEPIDVDEYESRNESAKSEANVPETRNLNIEKLPKLIPRSSWLNNSSSNGTNSTRDQNPPPLHSSQKVTRQNSVICVSAPRSLANVTSMAANSSIGSSGAAAGPGNISPGSKGKISLVPTNLLLNQQKQLNAAAAAAGKNFYVSKSVSTITQSQMSQSSGDHSKSKMPMKVLLVNTMPKQTHLQTTSSTTSVGAPSNKAEMIPIPMESTAQFNCQAGLNKIAAQVPTQQSMRRGRSLRRRPMGQTLTVPGMKSMLTSLIRTQQRANALTRERLQMDRERFNYEKRIVDEVMGLIPFLKDIGAQLIRQQQRHEPQEQAAAPHLEGSAVHCNGHQGAGEEEDDEDDPVVVVVAEDEGLEIRDESNT